MMLGPSLRIKMRVVSPPWTFTRLKARLNAFFFFYPRCLQSTLGGDTRCLHSTLGGDIISQVAKGTLQ